MLKTASGNSCHLTLFHVFPHMSWNKGMGWVELKSGVCVCMCVVPVCLCACVYKEVVIRRY